MSFELYVGDICLQQLAQLRQSTSCQTSVLIMAMLLSNARGGFFSIPRKYFRNIFFRRLSFFLKEYRLTGCMDVGIRLYIAFALAKVSNCELNSELSMVNSVAGSISNSKSAITNLQSAIVNPKSKIVNRKSACGIRIKKDTKLICNWNAR